MCVHVKSITFCSGVEPDSVKWQETVTYIPYCPVGACPFATFHVTLGVSLIRCGRGCRKQNISKLTVETVVSLRVRPQAPSDGRANILVNIRQRWNQ